MVAPSAGESSAKAGEAAAAAAVVAVKAQHGGSESEQGTGGVVRFAEDRAEERTSFSRPFQMMSGELGGGAGGGGSATSGGGHGGVEAADVELTAVGATAALPSAPHDVEAGPAAVEDEDTIGFSDFICLFQSLDLPLTDGQVERLFAMTDLDGNGVVTAEEFESAWDDLLDEFVEVSVLRMGLSPALTALLVSGLVLSVAVLLAFILVTLSAWTGNDSFDAVAQSLLVGGVGRAAAALPKANAHDDDQLKKVVDAIMGEQESASKDE